MSKFNGKKQTSVNIVKNNEGELVYGLSPLKTLLMKVLGSFYAQDTFYKSKEIDKEFDDLVSIIDSIDEKDKEYILKVAELGRYSGMIEYPLNVLTACYNMDKFKGENFLNENNINKLEYYSDKIVRRTKDINHILATQFTIYGKKLPKQMRKNLKGKLEFFDKYKLSKGLDINKKVSLADAIKILHPEPKNEDMAQFFKDIIEGKVRVGNDKKQIQSEITNIRRAEKENKKVDITDLKENLIEAMYKSNLSALLKNILMLNKYEIFNDDEHLNFVCDKISSRENIIASKIMPYQIYALYKAMFEMPNNKINTRIRESLESALEESIYNIPNIEGYTAYLIDVSGSMGFPMSNNSSITLKELACLLGAIAYKKGQGDLFVFSNSCERISVSRNSSIFDIVDKTLKTVRSAGTCLDIALTTIEDFAKQNKLKYDNLLFLSDNDCYSYSLSSNDLKFGGTAFNNRINRLMNKETGIFDTIWINNLAGEKFTVFNTDDNNKNLIMGYSEKFIEVINLYYNVRNNKDIRPLIDALLDKYKENEK